MLRDSVAPTINESHPAGDCKYRSSLVLSTFTRLSMNGTSGVRQSSGFEVHSTPMAAWEWRL